MSGLHSTLGGRRFFGAAVFVLGMFLLAALIRPVAAADDPVTLTITKQTDPAGGTGFPFALASVGPVGTWGSTMGNNPGQFNLPTSVAADPWGNVFVTDGYRVQKFDAGGNFLLQWGSYGATDGNFLEPDGIAVDMAGTVFVADTFNHRVQVFTNTGTFIRKWGSTGTDNGQMTRPYGIAVDGDGYVYVADSGNNRIQKFDSLGNYVKQWGGTGAGNGQFNLPHGVAVDGNGFVYVTDRNNHRVQKFDTEGVFQNKWGSNGYSDGQFTYPVGVAVDGAGNVFVSDSNRVQKFSALGVFRGKWTGFNLPFGVGVGSNGAIYVADTFNFRIQKFVDAAPTLDDDDSVTYTLDPAPYRLGETVPAGWSLASIACDGGNPQVNGSSVSLTLPPGEDITCDFTNTQPGGITIIKEVDGQIPATDWAFTGGLGGFTIDKSGGTKPFTGLDAGTYTLNETAVAGYAQSVTCDSGETGTGSVTVNLAPGENVTCTFTNTAEPGTIFFTKEVIGPDRAEPWTFSGNLGDFATYAGNVEYFPNLPAGNYTITETAVDGYTPAAACDSGETGTGSITVALEPGENVHCTFTNTAQPATLTLTKETNPAGGENFPFTLVSDGPSFLWGSYGTADGQFRYPVQVAVDSAGNVYVSDIDAQRIQVFDRFGNFLRGWDVEGFVSGMAVDTDGEIFITDELFRRIQVFSPTGSVLREWDTDGQPARLALDAAGNVYMTDGDNNRVQKFDGDGVLLDEWGSYGTGNGEFVVPDHIAVGGGYVYVFDYNHRVQKFDTDGNYITQWGSEGSGPGQFEGGARGMTVSTAGNVYVTDGGYPMEDYRIQKFDANGAFLTQWGEFGSDPGQFNVIGGLAIDAIGNLYVTDAQNRRVQKYFDGAVTLDDGESVTFDLNAAGYDITELLPADWGLTDISCDGGDPQVSGDSVHVTLSPAADIECIFTNTALSGSITVVKELVGAVPPADWAFTGDLDPFTIDKAGGSKLFDDLPIESYEITETAVPGYTQSVSCTNGATGSGSVTVDLQPGENVTCTFTNTAQPGSITIIKEVTGLVPSTDWAFTGDLGDFALPGDGGERTFQSLVAGTYTINETAVAGYTQEVLCGSGESGTDSVTLVILPGTHKVCTFTNTAQAGRVTIIKEASVEGETEFGFGTDIGAPNSFTLVDNGVDPNSYTFEDVSAGTYLVSEDETWGWTLTDIVCDDTDSADDIVTRSATLQIAPAEHVTCTFSNEQDTGTLIIIKSAAPEDDTPFDFTHNLPGDPMILRAVGFTLRDPSAHTATFSDVPVGEYSVTESETPGWRLEEISCTGGLWSADLVSGRVTVDLTKDATITCTFSNTALPGSITIVKGVVGQLPAADWAFTGTLGDFAIDKAGGTEPFTNLVGGNYTITETAVAGYVQEVSCDSGETGTDSVTVNLQPGEDVLCTFTNTAQPGSITVVKEVIGQVPSSDWAFTGDFGEFIIAAAGGNKLFTDLVSDEYTITETAKPGYSQSVSCTSGETGAGSVTVNLQPGENVTCTFTNTAQAGSITIVKTVIGQVPASDWAFTGDLGEFTLPAAGGTSEPFTKPAGEYTINETAKPGYSQAVVCDTGETGTGSVTVELQPGETATCTFTNTAEAGSITIIKQVEGQLPQNDWQFTGDLGEFTLPAAGGTSEPFVKAAGEYTITETAVAGYDQAVICDSGETGSDSVTVDLAPGEVVNCTFINSAKPGSVTIVKQVIGQVPDSPWAFTGDLDGFTIPAAGGTKPFTKVFAGSYTINETAVAGYSQSVSCTSGESGSGSVTIDLAPDEAVTCTFINTALPGSITVVKNVVGQNPPVDWQFTGSLGEFNIDAAGGNKAFTDLAAGNYTINETARPGYRQKVSCTNNASGSDSVSIKLHPGEDVTCTFVNTADPGSITIVKTVIGQVPASDWAYTGDLGEFTIDKAGGTKPFVNLHAGDYSISETAKPGYSQAVSCDTGETGEGSVTISLQPGENVTCTFTNTAQAGSITIVKTVVGQVPPADWSYTGDLGEFTIAAAGDTKPFNNLAANSYTVNETAKLGYSQAVSCDSGETGAGSVTVDLQPGENVTCTFTNTAQAGSITIVKTVIGQVPASDWAYTGDLGEFTIDKAGGTKPFVNLHAGDYSISETIKPGYSQAVSCDTGETGEGSVTISLQPGENVTCNFTNTAQAGSITIVKTVIGQVPGSDWSYTGDLGEFTIEAAGGNKPFTGLVADDYTINETTKPGYSQAVSCDSGETGIDSVTISLQPAENVTCTFTNTAQAGSITIVKTVIGQVPGSDWSYTGDLGEFTIEAAGGNKPFTGLTAGSYTVYETTVTGYSQAVACDSGETGTGSVAVDLQPGENVTCTFTNTAQPGSITIVKTVIGQVPASDWAYTGDLGAFTIDKAGGTKPFADLVAGSYTVNETAQNGYTQFAVCDSGETGTGSVTIDLQPGENVTCTFTNTAQPGSITIVKTVVGQVPAGTWQFTGGLGAFTVPAGGGSKSFTNLAAGRYTINETAVPDYTQSVVCNSGETGTGSVTVDLQPSEAVTCTYTNTYVPPPVTAVFLSTTAAGKTSDGQAFGSEDIIRWDGSAWSTFFDGSAAGLEPRRAKHSINAFWIPDASADDFIFSFVQNRRTVPGIAKPVDGMDLVQWDGSKFSVYFDGSDVFLTVLTSEKIDALHILEGSRSPINGGNCQAYLLVSTQGPGKVPNYSGGQIKFGGEDVLGFCATSLGDTTTGLWHLVLDGSAEGMPRNSTDSISMSDDGQTMYLTTQGAFNVDSAAGGHSVIYAYDFVTKQFSGPLFSAPAHGVAAKVNGLQVEGDLP